MTGLVVTLRWTKVPPAQQNAQLLVFTPQAINAKRLCRTVLTEGLVVGGTSRIALPYWRHSCDPALWFWLYGNTENECHQTVQVRKGTAVFRGLHDWAVGDTVTASLVHIDSTVGGEMRAEIIQLHLAAPLESKQLVPYGSREQALVKGVCQRMSQFFLRHQQTIPNVSNWDSSIKTYPVGSLPGWAFVYEYACRPFQARQELVFLERLYELAECRVKPDAPHRLSEILGEMVVLMPVSWAYCLDRNPKGVSEDQWTHPLVAPHPGAQGYDCEDGAATMYLVCQLLLRVNPANASRDLANLILLAQRYSFVVAIGTLLLPEAGPGGKDAHTYHAYVLGFDRRLRPRVPVEPNPAPRVNYHPRHSMDAPSFQSRPARRPTDLLPPLVCESTEYTQSVLAPARRNDQAEQQAFGRQAIDDTQLHTRIPASILRDANQYETLVQFIDPESRHGTLEQACCHVGDDMGERHSILNFWNPSDPDAKGETDTPLLQVGVPFTDFIAWAQGVGPEECPMLLVPTTTVTREEEAAIVAAVSQLPRTPLPQPAKSTGAPRNPLHIATSLAVARLSDARAHQAEWMLAWRERGLSVTTKDVELFDGWWQTQYQLRKDSETNARRARAERALV